MKIHPNPLKKILFPLLILAAFQLQAQVPLLKNVQESFQNLPSKPKVLQMKWQGPELSTGGHAQGIQMYYKGKERYWIFSGSGNEYGYIAVAKAKDDWLAQHDYVLKFAPPFSHAGGIQVAGNWLVVGIEDANKKDASFVRLYDLENALSGNLEQGIKIARQGTEKESTAGENGLLQLKDGRFLIVTGSWDCKTVDLYLSEAGVPLNEDSKFTRIHHLNVDEADKSGWIDAEFPAYQNLNLVADQAGKVYAIGLGKQNGKNVMDLFELNWQAETPDQQILRKVAHREMKCAKGASFRMGGGVVVNSQGELEVFAVSESVDHKMVINQFR
ncbi:MAG: hypothetical protein H6581_06665 [Bacteroidia bacterium]|nr:hypothetical protein [Bacteroidia bacterium]